MERSTKGRFEGLRSVVWLGVRRILFSGFGWAKSGFSAPPRECDRGSLVRVAWRLKHAAFRASEGMGGEAGRRESGRRRVDRRTAETRTSALCWLVCGDGVCLAKMRVWLRPPEKMS